MNTLRTNDMLSPVTHGAEIDSFLVLMQAQYAEALQYGDEPGMAETSGTLAISYAALARHDLAQRWSREFLDLYFRCRKQQSAT